MSVAVSTYVGNVLVTHPKMTRGYFSDCLKCPHCGAYTDDAKVSLQDICFYWPLASWVPCREDGYAKPFENVQFDCPSCEKPIAIGISKDEIKLVACRTLKDEERLYGKIERKGYGA